MDRRKKMLENTHEVEENKPTVSENYYSFFQKLIIQTN